MSFYILAGVGGLYRLLFVVLNSILAGVGGLYRLLFGVLNSIMAGVGRIPCYIFCWELGTWMFYFG